MKTLGIFAKQPVPGRVKTRLAADWGNERAAALYECFVRDLLVRFATVGDRRVIGFAPDREEARQWFETASRSSADSDDWILWPQPDCDLGMRMAAWFKSWTGSPEHRTVLIGSDSPTLPVEYLERAWQLLEDNDSVLGPASDGGYYLIGMRGSVSDFEAPFRDVEWSTAGVLSQTVELLKQHNLSLGLLPAWYDVDSVDAVASLSGHLAALNHANELHGLQTTTDFLTQEFQASGRSQLVDQ